MWEVCGSPYFLGSLFWFLVPGSVSALCLCKRISQSIRNADFEMFWRKEGTVLAQLGYGVLVPSDGCSVVVSNCGGVRRYFWKEIFFLILASFFLALERFQLMFRFIWFGWLIFLGMKRDTFFHLALKFTLELRFFQCWYTWKTSGSCGSSAIGSVLYATAVCNFAVGRAIEQMNSSCSEAVVPYQLSQDESPSAFFLQWFLTYDGRC